MSTAYAERDCEKCIETVKTPRPAYERYSLGIFAGYACDKCWEQSGYRKEGPEGFDPMDAGESYEDDY